MSILWELSVRTEIVSTGLIILNTFMRLWPIKIKWNKIAKGRNFCPDITYLRLIQFNSFFFVGWLVLRVFSHFLHSDVYFFCANCFLQMLYIGELNMFAIKIQKVKRANFGLNSRLLMVSLFLNTFHSSVCIFFTHIFRSYCFLFWLFIFHSFNESPQTKNLNMKRKKYVV